MGVRNVAGARCRPLIGWVLALCLPGLAGLASLTGSSADGAVPTPTGNDAVLTVEVGGDRQVSGAVGPLAGVVLQLLVDDAGTAGAAVDQPWSTCTSDAAGDCSFVVPDTQTRGANRDRRFWVSQVSAPAGWYTNPRLRVGSSDASTSLVATYRFRTGAQLRAGTTYRSGSDFMTDLGTATTQRQSSGGVWQQSRDNPAFPAKCGLDVALILDLSGSVGSDLPNLRGAADSFVDSLVGTPSRMSVFSFSYTSPATGASANYPSLQPVSTAAGAATVKGRYAGWAAGGGTNWDRGIASAANAADHYDLAVVITDGNPTNYGTRVGGNGAQGSGSNDRVREDEEAVFSANALKAQGTRVVALGVGAGVTDGNTALNLRAISGATAYNGSNPDTADYFQEPSYAAAATALHAIALDSCEGSISVVKQIVPSANTGEDVTGAVPAPEGWAFQAAGSPNLAVTPTTATTTDDGTGSVNFDLVFSGGAETGPATFEETQQTGYTLVTQGGANAVCTNLSTGASVPVTNTGSATHPGFTLTAVSQAAISCTLYNRPPSVPPEASLSVDKLWTIDTGTSVTTVPDGSQPGFLQSQLTVTSPVDGLPEDLGWGVTANGYEAGDTPTLDETATVDRPGCALVSQAVTEVRGDTFDAPVPYTASLNPGANHYTITNTVRCTTHLTLVKVVDNADTGRTGVPSDWNLTATGPSTVTGPGGSTAITDQTIALGDYTLSESTGPSGYEAGGWDCVGAEQTGDDSISATLGQDIVCTVVNTAQAEPAPPLGPGTPHLTTHTSARRVAPGTGFYDRVHLSDVSGSAASSGLTAQARLYGPFPSRARAACTPAHLARTITWHAVSGTSHSPKVHLRKPGVYTWQVTTLADAANRAATHPCGQSAETTTVAKRSYTAPIIDGGFSGTLTMPVSARRTPFVVAMRSIGLDAPVTRERISRDHMTLPRDVADVGWLGRSAGVGDLIGTTVIAGHVSDRHDRPGAMNQLSGARRGRIVTISHGGRVYRFDVTHTASYARGAALPRRFFDTTGRHRLVLVSCTDRVVYPNGHFHYTRYRVVVAAPVAVAGP